MLQDKTRYLSQNYPMHAKDRVGYWLWNSPTYFPTGGQVGFVGRVKDGFYKCVAFIDDQIVGFSSNIHCVETPPFSVNEDIYLHFAIVTGEKFTLALPRLGKEFYIRKFKDVESQTTNH
jgi:hypothetical protein